MYGVNPYLSNPYSQATFTSNPYFKAGCGIQFVNDIESARAYPLLPNSQAILMDKNMSRFYWAEADAAGAKSIKAYDFREAKENQGNKYVTIEEFERWKARYEPALRPKEQPGDVIEATPIYEVDQSASGASTDSAVNRFRTY